MASTIFKLIKITTVCDFKNEVMNLMILFQNTRFGTIHCYFYNRYFRISTGKVVLDFDFGKQRCQKMVVEYVNEALKILHQCTLRENLILDDAVGAIDLLN